jgi:hypothetical protein
MGSSGFQRALHEYKDGYKGHFKAVVIFYFIYIYIYIYDCIPPVFIIQGTEIRTHKIIPQSLLVTL